MSHKFFLSIIILIIGIGGLAYLVITAPKSQAVAIKEQSWLVTTTTATLTHLKPVITLYGKVESPRTATLRSPTTSTNTLLNVKEVAVLEGQTVKKGQVLIRFDDADSQLAFAQREADVADLKASIDLEQQRYNNDVNSIEKEESLLALAKKSLERAKKLEKQKLGSEVALDESQQTVERQALTVSNRRSEINGHKARLVQYQARLDRAMSARDMAKLELGRLTVTAPFDAVITKVDVSVGDRLQTGSSLLTLYDADDLEIRAQIPSRYQEEVLATMKQGQILSAQAKWLGEKIEVQLDRVSGQINVNSGGIDGLFQVNTGKELLRLEQFLSLALQLPEQQNVIALPVEAIYGMDRIYLMVDNRMQGVLVERVGDYISTEGQNHILVRSDKIKAGDEIIITQLPNAMDGLSVRVPGSQQSAQIESASQSKVDETQQDKTPKKY